MDDGIIGVFGNIFLKRAIGRFAGAQNGNVLIVAALSFPVLIGMAALSAEYGGGMIERAENQRVADLASYAGALAYNKANSPSEMRAAAIDLAALNGIAAADVVVQLVASPKTAGLQAVNVRIVTQKPLVLSRVLSDRIKLDIAAHALTELGAKAATPGCVLALSGSQTGVTLSGGTRIDAEKCTVSSNNTVTVPCGTSITAIGVNYNSTAVPSQPCSGIKGPGGGAPIIAKQLTPDPLAGNAAVAAAVGRIATVAALTAPASPTVAAGGNISFAYDEPSTKAQAVAVGCTATKASSTWTLNCGTKASVNFGSITLGGGINVDFARGGAATTVYNFSGLVNNTGSVMRFGPGIYNMAKGLATGGGTTTTFDPGTFRIGMSGSTCGSGRYSICNTSTLTFGGPSIFELAAGFSNTGGSTLTFGSGTTNSFKIGPSSAGEAITIGGGAKTIMADALGSNGVFQVKGNINGRGGSCFAIPAALQHDIAGTFNASGAIFLGAGTYTIDGYLALGADGGGSVSCNGQTVSVRAVGVTLVLSGKTAANSGSCNGFVFCVAAGYSNILLTAPTSGATAKLAVIGPQSSTKTAGATFSEGGAGAQISGVFYFPNGPIIMSGGTSTFGDKTDPSKCLQIIGSRITLTGGAAAASECLAASGATTSSKVSLVQ